MSLQPFRVPRRGDIPDDNAESEPPGHGRGGALQQARLAGAGRAHEVEHKKAVLIEGAAVRVRDAVVGLKDVRLYRDLQGPAPVDAADVSLAPARVRCQAGGATLRFVGRGQRRRVSRFLPSPTGTLS